MRAQNKTHFIIIYALMGKGGWALGGGHSKIDLNQQKKYFKDNDILFFKIFF